MLVSLLRRFTIVKVVYFPFCFLCPIFWDFTWPDNDAWTGSLAGPVLIAHLVLLNFFLIFHSTKFLFLNYSWFIYGGRYLYRKSIYWVTTISVVLVEFCYDLTHFSISDTGPQTRGLTMYHSVKLCAIATDLWPNLGVCVTVANIDKWLRTTVANSLQVIKVRSFTYTHMTSQYQSILTVVSLLQELPSIKSVLCIVVSE